MVESINYFNSVKTRKTWLASGICRLLTLVRPVRLNRSLQFPVISLHLDGLANPELVLVNIDILRNSTANTIKGSRDGGIFLMC
jgi:hypothetical protein